MRYPAERGRLFPQRVQMPLLSYAAPQLHTDSVFAMIAGLLFCAPALAGSLCGGTDCLTALLFIIPQKKSSCQRQKCKSLTDAPFRVPQSDYSTEPDEETSGKPMKDW
jgi:hypothetical protein